MVNYRYMDSSRDRNECRRQSYGLVDEGVTESTLLESDMDNILVLLASLCVLNPLGQLFLINPSLAPPPLPPLLRQIQTNKKAILLYIANTFAHGRSYLFRMGTNGRVR